MIHLLIVGVRRCISFSSILDTINHTCNLTSRLSKYPDETYVKYGYDAFGRKVYREEAYWNKEAGDAPGKSEYAPGQNKEKSNNGKGNNKENGSVNGSGKSKAEKVNLLKLKTDVQTYQYDGFTNTVLNEYTGNGSPLSQYYMANDKVVSKKTFGNHSLVIPGREPSLKTNGGLMYYHYDGMRNVTELTDRNGDSIEQYRYDAFGGLYTGVTAPYNTYSLAGKSYDPKANLIDMHARWYQAQNGRFTTADPYRGEMLTPYTQNRYAYVGNNPINRWDPLGYWEDGDENLTPKAQAAIRRLTEKYFATEDEAERDKIHAQADSIRSRDMNRWETEKEVFEKSWDVTLDIDRGTPYKVSDGWRTDWTKTIEHIDEYKVTTSYYSGYAGKYAESIDYKQYSTIKHTDGFDFRPFTAQEWYEEHKDDLSSYGDPPPYNPPSAYSTTTSEYAYSSSRVTSGTARLFNGDEVVWEYESGLGLKNSGVNYEEYKSLINSIDWGFKIIEESILNISVIDVSILPASAETIMPEMSRKYEVTVEQLKEFGWANADLKLADEINDALSMFGINEGEFAKEQIILFMATAGHEAGMGNYNYIQAGASGPYRGAGALQLTDKAAYVAFDNYLTNNLEGYNGEILKSNEPYKVVAEKYAWVSAAWVWTENKKNKERLDKYMESGYELYDSFIVTTAFVQGYRGSNDDYRKIAAGQYKPIDYSAAYSGKYGTQNVYDVVDIHVINGGTVVSSNNWNDRKAIFEKAYKVFGGH